MSDTPDSTGSTSSEGTAPKAEAPKSFETTILTRRCTKWMWIADIVEENQVPAVSSDGLEDTVVHEVIANATKPRQCKLNLQHKPPCDFGIRGLKTVKERKRASKNWKPKKLWIAKCIECLHKTTLCYRGPNKGKCDWCIKRGTPYVPGSAKGKWGWEKKKARQAALTLAQAPDKDGNPIPKSKPAKKAPSGPASKEHLYKEKPIAFTVTEGTEKDLPPTGKFTFKVGTQEDIE